MRTHSFILARVGPVGADHASMPADPSHLLLDLLGVRVTTELGLFKHEAGGSSEEEVSGGEIEAADIMSRPFTNEDRELKDKLLRKYSGYISTLKHEFSKKKTTGKLPNEARQILLDWWTLHFKWPYPTEADKIALSELTGLDQKQINNWFINQRKRHWKHPQNMQVAIMEAHSLSGPFCHE